MSLHSSARVVMKCLAAISMLVAVGLSFAASSSEPSAQTVLARIAKEGGRKVLWDLWEHEEEYGYVFSGIESGDASWLKVASALRPFSDAGATLTLDFAVARALPKAPERVLALIGHGFDFEFICTSPFIEPEPGVAEAYEQKTLLALSKVKSPALAPIAAQCAERVRLPAQ